MPDHSHYYPDHYHIGNWLPISLKEVKDRNWEQLDVILITGDAYVDHPSFGIPVIGRILEREGYKVAIIPQPNWRDDLRDFVKLGKPRLFFGVAAGNMDSMVNHYTANRRLRSNDAYSIGNQAGFRPDRAVSVYSGILSKLYPDTYIVAGGIEASLRRLTHYDYWDNELKPSILHNGIIDFLVYGNGEKPIIQLAKEISAGASLEQLHQIPQMAYAIKTGSTIKDWPERKTIQLSSFEESKKNKEVFASDFRIIEEESNTLTSARITQSSADITVVVNPPFSPASVSELDHFHNLPFTRLPHPRYWKKPVIPAFEMIRFSVNIHRGCFGGCAFCTISAHQGKHISSRSTDSVMAEVNSVAKMPGFKGYLSDLGGPSANMYGMAPYDISICRRCRKPSCIHPGICKNLNISHKKLIDLYRKVRELPEIKKAFIGSGVRYDLFLNERSKTDPSLIEYPEELIRFHVSGRLKVAPEHTQPTVLKVIRKPGFEKFLELKRVFDGVNERHQLRQELIPYFISSHPGCSLEDMAELTANTRALNLNMEQVQDLTPTPMTLASTMFYSGFDPYTLKPIFVATNAEEKKLQRSFFQISGPEERQKIINVLKKINRDDLIPKIFGNQNKLKHVKGKPRGRQNK
jgi:uncharacterized radical SAM protein YgiQ